MEGIAEHEGVADEMVRVRVPRVVVEQNDVLPCFARLVGPALDLERLKVEDVPEIVGLQARKGVVPELRAGLDDYLEFRIALEVASLDRVQDCADVGHFASPLIADLFAESRLRRCCVAVRNRALVTATGCPTGSSFLGGLWWRSTAINDGMPRLRAIGLPACTNWRGWRCHELHVKAALADTRSEPGDGRYGFQEARPCLRTPAPPHPSTGPPSTGRAQHGTVDLVFDRRRARERGTESAAKLRKIRKATENR